ncbi:MAG: metallophosphoesterase [Frankia sp.]
MKYAIIADLHGRRGAWRRVRQAAGRAGADRLLLLGDYLEAKVPRRLHDPAVHWPIEEVVRPDERLWAELADAELVLGNQELRIHELLHPEQVPAALAPLLAAPRAGTVGVARAEHGDRIRWSEAPDGILEPRLDGVFRSPMLLVGHTHQTLLLDVTGTSTLPVSETSTPAGASGLPNPARPVIRRLPITVDRPVPVRPDAHLLVNVGQARGRPSHWLLYDTGPSEITFKEVDN